MPSPELKPCPFCGGEAEIHDFSCDGYTTAWAGSCKDDDCPGWVTANYFRSAHSLKEAVERWNRRAANAALIVDAVNERDRLRDIVRRMMGKLAVLNAGYRLMLSEGPEDKEMADLCESVDALLREARAAIGEDAR